MKIYFASIVVLYCSIGSTQARIGTTQHKPDEETPSNQQGLSKLDTTKKVTYDWKHEPSVAEPEEEEDIQIDDKGPDEEIQATAELLGIDLDEAALLWKQQVAFSQVVDSMEDDDLFSQAVMPEEVNGKFVVMYKGGELPKHHQYTIENFMNKHDLEVTTVATRRSLKEAEKWGDSLTDKLEQSGYTFVSYSIDGDNLEISAKLPSESQIKGGQLLPKDLTAKILEIRDEEDLRNVDLFVYEDGDDDPEGDEHTYGGRRISGGGYQCTTAFSVVHTSGTTGVATAAHCNGMDRYDAVPPESDYATSFQRQHNGYWGDMEWHTTEHIEPAQYYATPSTKWPVRSVARSISKNQVVCVYSRMQGRRTCDRVYRTCTRQGRNKRLVAMRGHNTVGGDSGGPWSFYDMAFGIHKGWRRIWFKRRNTFSRASYLGPALGVLVRTQ